MSFSYLGMAISVSSFPMRTAVIYCLASASDVTRQCSLYTCDSVISDWL